MVLGPSYLSTCPLLHSLLSDSSQLLLPGVEEQVGLASPYKVVAAGLFIHLSKAMNDSCRGGKEQPLPLSHLFFLSLGSDDD